MVGFVIVGLWCESIDMLIFGGFFNDKYNFGNYVDESCGESF